MFSRKMFTPAAIMLRIISGDSVAGPRVAIIFVFLISGAERRIIRPRFQELVSEKGERVGIVDLDKLTTRY